MLSTPAVAPCQKKVIRHLTACRTPELGGHLDCCTECDYQRVSYNSCRDRHCPKCQATKRADWLDGRLQRLLPVEYFHVVFTVPEELNALMLGNAKLLYNVLFKAASETLLQLARDPKRLGGQIGFTAVLHTWGQTMQFHPHVHCVVTGGGLSTDGQRWVSTKSQYFLPVHVLGSLFRGKFLAEVRRLRESGELRFQGSTAGLLEDRRFRGWLAGLYRSKWVVYAKPPFGGPEQVYRYLGRYTHRVAISNHRLVSMTDEAVTFRYKDYADDCQTKTMKLAPAVFIRRFLLHVLPKRFVRIRHYGILAGRNVDTKLAKARTLLDAEAPEPPASKTWVERLIEWTDEDPRVCPHCHSPLVRWAFDSRFQITQLVVLATTMRDTS